VKTAFAFALTAFVFSAVTFAQPQQRDLRLEPIRVQKKIALVIGNQAYPKSPLRNPINDAAAIAQALRALQFDEVIERRDLTMRRMRAEIDGFAAKLRPGDLAFFYYAGHGVQANEQNYLIPTDFAGTSEADLPYESYPASQVRDKLEQSGARMRILVLDACRNNPFRTKRDGARGLSPMASSVEGTYIAYATADNGVADDNPAESNGLFTKQLLAELQKPGLDLKQIFERAKEDVYVASGRKQRPFTYDGVIGQFYFMGPVTIVNNPLGASSDLARREEIEFWGGIDKTDAASLQMYLQRYPNGTFAAIAQRDLTRISESASSKTPAAPGAAPVMEPKNTLVPPLARNADTPDFVGVSTLDTPVIETIAGRDWQFSGNGMPARQVPLGYVYGVACDRAGNLYATDWLAGYLFKIDIAGFLHVLVGPDSPPGNRPINPYLVTVDLDGAVYFTQDGNVRIMKLSPNGKMESVAGTGRAEFAPDGRLARQSPVNAVRSVAFAPDGTMVFSERYRVRRIDRQGLLQTIAGNGLEGCGGDGGPAQAATLNLPQQMAYDAAGNLLIADQGCASIRKVSPNGIISTLAGRDVLGDLGQPIGLAVNSRGDVFAASLGRIFRIHDRALSVFAGTGSLSIADASGDGGAAIQATFASWQLAVDAHDNLFSGGWVFGHVNRIDPDGKYTIVAGNGQWRLTTDGTPARDALFRNLQRVVLDGNRNVFLLDARQSNRIYRIDRSGSISRFAGGFAGPYRDNVPARESSLGLPWGLRARPDGTVVFSDDRHRVYEVGTDGQIHVIAGNGRAGYTGDGGPALEATLNNPNGLCLDAAGAIYIADTGSHRVRKVTPDGKISLVAGDGMAGFAGDGGPADRASLRAPTGVEIGPDGALYIADAGNNRVRRVSGGVITTIAGNGSKDFGGDGGSALNAGLFTPTEIAFGPDRKLYVLDVDHARIRRIDLVSGTISTVAGNGEPTASGDGGPPLGAGLGAPRGLAIDSAGNLYVTDVKSGRLRIVRPARNRISLPPD